jgi:acyl carrier protein
MFLRGKEMDEQLKKRLNRVIVDDVGIALETIDPSRPIREVVNLDSMQFVSLIAKIEIELEVELPIGIMQVNTLSEFYKAVSSACEDAGAGKR